MREYKNSGGGYLSYSPSPFSILGYFSTEIYRVASPIPQAFISDKNVVLTTEEVK
ncbi:hypothetical protein tinsulaeT_25550 [Thalassotalea insulae]|uniref:Uncharacterized protein n=1 Tax=Thalassotalea insulae TaxID=2056778 RepID=A0ABQ6GTE8_9GAMM|nr:hypothetical protein [Thalassotalea insulae]GLX79215.1 hypothetical protein tinsulaeT_25550 [Thalassotalea insulae]